MIVYTWQKLDQWFDYMLTRNPRIRRLLIQMSAVQDYADQINEITNQNADDIASVASELQDLKDQVANSDSDVAAAFDPIISKLQANSDALKALANPNSADNPAPIPSDAGTDTGGTV